MARFYSNENFPQQTVEALRQLGHDVLTSHDAGQSNQAIPDEGVLQFSTSKDRILLTLNRKHFVRLHDDIDGNHAGIIVCTQDLDYQGLAQRVDAAIAGHVPFAGMLVRVNRPDCQPSPGSTLLS